MQFTSPKRSLMPLLSKATQATDPKSSMPALACLLISADGDNIHVSATDLYLAVSGRADAKVTRPGKVAVSARDVLERVKAMPEGAVTLTTDKDRLRVAAGSRRFELHTFPADDMPSTPRPTDAAPFTISAEALGSLIDRTRFSISTDETRAHINSALFEIGGGEARMVSTDGHRLTCASVECAGGSTSMLIPLRAINALSRLLVDGEVTVTVGPSVFFAFADGSTFAAKQVDAQFPPWKQVIPRDPPRSIELPRDQLLEAVRAVKLASSKMTNAVKLRLETDVLHVFSESPEAGNGADEIPVDYSGESLTIGFNAAYLADALGACGTERVTLGLGGELDPGLVRPAGESGLTAVVMPCRV